jgi:nitrous oxidase accessory protein
MKRTVAILALAAGAAHGSPAVHGDVPAGLPGPRDVAAPAGATVVSTFETLRELIAAADGPRLVVLAPGHYRGEVVIDRPISIFGMRGAVLDGGGHGSVVTIHAKDVTLQNVVVRGSGKRHTKEDAGIKASGDRVTVRDVRIEDSLFGISLQECRDCVVERAYVVGEGDDTELRGDGIKLWESHGSHVRGCVVDRSRDVVVWYTRRATLEDNVVTRSRYGTHFMYAHDAVVRNSRLENNIVGIFVMYSMRLIVEDNVLAGARGAAGVGIGFKDSDAVQVRRNWMVANTTGTYLDNTPRVPSETVSFEGNVLALNDVGLRLHGTERGLRIHGNDFRDNAAVIAVDGGSDALSVDVRGNHFSDYEGYDLDRDGTGDVAYEVKALSSELTERRPALKFFHGSAAMGIIDAVAHAVPVLSSQRLLVDPAPRMSFP